MARTLLGACAKVLATEWTLRRREKFVENVETEKAQALSRVSSGAMGVPGPDGQADPDDPGSVANPGRHIRDLMDNEQCGTCKACLRRLLRQPPEGRREGIRVYEGAYLDTKAAFETGEASKDELKEATREFFSVCGML